MTEEWRPVKDYIDYFVSNWGRIKSLKSGEERILKPGINKGHLQVELRKDGEGHNKQVHRLVAEAFIPNPENKPYVDHIDGNPLNTIEIDAYLVVLTTNSYNSQYSTGTEPTRTIVELRKRDEYKKELKVTPDSLLFEAEGGTQTVKVEAKGYKFYGGFSGSDCEKWITVDNEKLGTFTVTATPNNTANERKGTIYAFGTQSENPTADNTDLLPIKVTQKANNHQISQVEISSVKIQSDMKTNCTRHHYTHEGKIDKEEVYTHSLNDTQTFSSKYISSNISGSSLHVDIDYDNNDDHYDISFDVTGLSGDYKEARVTNLTYKRVSAPKYVFGHDRLNSSVIFTNIPVSKIYRKNASDPLTLNSLIFDGKVADNVGISGLFHEKYWTDGYGGYFSESDDYINDGDNFVTLTIDFNSVK